jgi:hypothetical protein
VFYGGSWAVRGLGLTHHEGLLNTRVALEGLSLLALAAGLVWGIVASVATRRAVAIIGSLLNAAALAVLFYRVFLSVKK